MGLASEFGFIHIGPDVCIPEMLVESIRFTHPHAKIIQLTDQISPIVTGVDETYRSRFDPGLLSEFRVRAYIDGPCSDGALLLDTDMLVLSQIQSIEAGGADLGICTRPANEHYAPINSTMKFSREEKDFSRSNISIDLSFPDMDEYLLGEVMPYNSGFIYSFDRCAWIKVLGKLDDLPAVYRRWYGIQRALPLLSEEGALKIKELDSNLYNHTPQSLHESLSDHRILHFKGRAKSLMRPYSQQLMQNR